MNSLAETITEEAVKEFPMSNSSKLSDEDVNRIAEAVVEKAAEDVGVRDIMIGSVMGKGAIPLYGRETRQEPCACCLIDPAGPNAPENRMCTTKGAIGTLSNREERDWCSEIEIVPDGRCTRARAIGEAARECKEKYPEDTAKFFECYIPAFSQITRGSSNPMAEFTPEVQAVIDKWKGQIAKGEPLVESEARREIIRASGYKGGVGKTDEAIRAIIKGGNPGDEPRSKYYYCGNAHLHPNNEVLQVKTLQDNPKCPYCGAIMTYGRYWGPLLATQKEYVTITDPGKTTFKVGEIISREAFEKENERVKKLSEKPATGR